MWLRLIPFVPLWTKLVLSAFVLTGTAAPLCSVDVAPRVGLAPVTYVRVITKIDIGPDWREAQVTLFDDSSELRRSQVFGGDAAMHRSRTTTIEWKGLTLTDEGVYYVHLEVIGQGIRCDAKTTLEVHGGHE